VVSKLRSYTTSVAVSAGVYGGACVRGGGGCVGRCAWCSCKVKFLCPAGKFWWVGLCV
jgi:hypothetical protein